MRPHSVCKLFLVRAKVGTGLRARVGAKRQRNDPHTSRILAFQCRHLPWLRRVPTRPHFGAPTFYNEDVSFVLSAFSALSAVNFNVARRSRIRRAITASWPFCVGW